MTTEQVEVLARFAGLAIDPAHIPGVIRNLDILLAQAAVLANTPLDPLVEPAPVFRP
jgi:hypothetical protein